MKKKSFLLTLIYIACTTSWSQNLSVSGSCVSNTEKLTIEGYVAATTYNGKPVYYHENLPISYQGKEITEDVHLYYALSSEIGTPENRWVISCGGQPYYYNISDSDKAPLGVYIPFDTNATPRDCGGSLTIALSNVSLDNQEFENANFNFGPNPTSSILTVSNIDNITNITVLNISGQILFSYKTSGKQIDVDLSTLAEATYFVRVSALDRVRLIKIIKKR